MVRDVAQFVQTELDDLPARFGWLLAIGLSGFRTITMLVKLRRFEALELEARRAWVERWAFGSFSLARQLFRGVRSTALLAYYDHALVRAQLLPREKAGAQSRRRSGASELMARPDAQVLVVGSGAGGAVTALELARRGLDVLVLEEGARHSQADYGKPAPEAMRRLYRRGGMTPIMGRVPIGYVEGRCVGGSTEINSGFWHRTPREALLRWKSQFDLADASEEELNPHFDWAEDMLGVASAPGNGRPARAFSRAASSAWVGRIKKCRAPLRGVTAPTPAPRVARPAPKPG